MRSNGRRSPRRAKRRRRSGGAPRSVRRDSVHARLPFQRFPRAGIPAGTAFPAYGPPPPVPDLPVADARAFSIDDATTTEVDDAFSVRVLPNGHYEVGIHIALPALGIARGSPLDALARSRLSTVYMPAASSRCCRTTWWPRSHWRRAARLPRCRCTPRWPGDGALLRHETRVNRVPVAANLHLDALDESFASGAGAVRSAVDHRAARALEVRASLSDARGKPDFARIDYSFQVDWEKTARGLGGRPRANRPRPRGSPLDKLVRS